MKELGLNVNVSLYFVAGVIISCTAQELSQGDPCTAGEEGQPGICTFFSKCEDLFRGFYQEGKIPETICSHLDDDPIVCCPTGEVVTTPKPQPSGRGKSYDMCKLYSKSVWTVKPSAGLSLGAKPENTSECAFKIQTLVVGGEKAASKEFPHMALIGYGKPEDKEWNCGGSLISENYVLTAAHCLYHIDFGEAKYVRLGDLNKARYIPDSEDPQEFDIADVYQPDEYDPPQYYNDIALLKMKETKKAIATGWGLTEYAGATSDDLLKVTLEFISNSDCNVRYQVNIDELPSGIIDKTQFCAGGHEKDTCFGDSGGPIQIYTPQEEFFCMYYLLGVTSFGKSCGIEHSAGVYSRIAAFVPWIENIVWPDT